MSEDKKTPSGHDEGKTFHYRRSRYKKKSLLAQEQAVADWFGIGAVLDEKSGIVPLEMLINQVVSSLPLEVPAIDSKILSKGWKIVAGDFISQNANLESIVNGIATIQVLQPAMRYHLKQWEPALIEKLKQQFGENAVHTIKYKLG